MTRKEAIDKVYRMIGTAEQHEALDFLVPEIRELREFYDRQQEDERIRKEISNLYSDIDGCITELLKARTNKDSEAEGKALFKMEGIMVGTLQDLSCIEDYLEKQKERKQEWSEKDSLHLTNAILSAEKEWGTESCTAKWLKSIPERFNLSSNPTWSEEERKILDSIIDDYEAAAKSFCGYDGKIGLLRAIRDGEYGLSKQEWSKEDKDIIDEAAELVLGWGYPNLSAKLKSLSMKCLKSLDNWKPSEEQIVAFRSYIENFEEKAEAAVGGWDNFNAMIQLYEQLKKLQSKSGKDDNG